MDKFIASIKKHTPPFEAKPHNPVALMNAQSMADDYFSLPPKLRTKKRMVQMVAAMIQGFDPRTAHLIPMKEEKCASAK